MDGRMSAEQASSGVGVGSGAAGADVAAPWWGRLQDALARLEAAAVVAAALLALVFWARLPGQLPSEDDWRSAARSIAAQARDGDAVLLDPHWAERARLFVTTTPVLDLSVDPSREDLARFARVFVLSLPELPRSDREGTFAFLESARLRRAGEPEPHGRASVTLFENLQREVPSFDFTAAVAGARVYIRRGDGSQEACPRAGERHPCPRASWIDVGAEIKEIDRKPHRCLWAHPAGSEPLVVEYPAVTLGRELKVMGGIVGQIAYRTERYGTVHLEVRIDGRLQTGLEFPPGRPGVRRRGLDTRALAGTVHAVSFEVRADNPDLRHFCFDAGIYP